MQENEYDARRYRTVRKDYSGGSLSATRHFYYSSGWQSVEERLGTSTDPDTQHVWGLRYIDDCVLRDRDTDANGTLDERLYALQDDNWNVIELTDENGDVQERYNYSAYGTPNFWNASFSTRSSSSYDWECLYAGYRYDATSELFCVRNRYLNSELGAWVSRDPIGYVDGMSLYGYVFSQPIDTYDPDGHQGHKVRRRCGRKVYYDDVRYPKWTCRNGRLLPKGLENDTAALDTALKSLCNDCDNCTICNKSDCEHEALRLADSIMRMLKQNSRATFPKLPFVRDERHKGYYCYEWVFGFEEAFNSTASGNCFEAFVNGAKVEADGRIHAWLLVRSACYGCSQSEIYVDDGFWEVDNKSKSKYVHYSPPCGGQYVPRPDALADNPRHSCNIPNAYGPIND